jgi:hypothetical protein
MNAIRKYFWNRFRLMAFLLLLGFVNLVVIARAQDIIWLETENFETHGGWVKDWQFIDQMGSPYLMAIGYGVPVSDAITTIDILEPGLYKLWVRTKDWIPEFNPGRFEIFLNGQRSGKIFGASGQKGWIWEEGGIHNLSDKVTLSLHDITGYYGRCDAIVLSRNMNWKPPVENEKISLLREKYSSVSGDINNMGTYDVVVIGGGIAGTLAAISAARQGAKTVLIQNRGELGGNASTEHLIPPVGTVQGKIPPRERKYDPRETGIIEEINPYGTQDYFIYGKKWPGRLKKLVESEPDLDLFLNTHAIDVDMKNKNNISGIICFDILSSQKISFNGKIFIDATGNGTIGLLAGADYMIGRESKRRYNEVKAPDIPNNNTLPGSLKYWYLPSDEPQPFDAPPWIYNFSSCSDFEPFMLRHPQIDKIDRQWVYELGGTNNIYENAEEVRDDLLRLIYGLWDHMKNHCTDPANKDALNMKLVWVGHVLGMRESYRLKGDYVMTENDITEQRIMEDRVAYGGWGMDDHPSLGFFDKTMYNDHTHRGIWFSIPYRSLYSKNIDNLMMAGRDISVTHAALTATRVMLTTGVIGHAVGTAAGMCINNQTYPRGIYQNYLTELQQKLIKEGAYLIELPNTDNSDLALKANIAASSELYPAGDAINGFSRARLPVTYSYSNLDLNAWIPDTTVQGPHWLQLTWNELQDFNVVHIVFQNRGKLAYKNFSLEINKNGSWKKILNVDNDRAQRRLILPVGELNTNALRIVLKDEECNGGICEVRVYDESLSTIEVIKRANTIVDELEEEVLLPWERD